ncbi:type II toxin-antitoxin system RelE/ParE family toxin [Parasphingorhabdus sp.]|uniref:type II toxin-antitoxin system RelE/ParE family toxin n=1 Tax=Parasphingorhabdus sp. TaxID=2709688 RepID=UPI003001605E
MSFKGQNVDLTLAVEEDLVEIGRYSFDRWGIKQADSYFDNLVECCEKIGDCGVRSKTTEGLPLGVEVMRCQEHYIFFMPDDRSIILAILHGSMDMLHHVKDRL